MTGTRAGALHAAWSALPVADIAAIAGHGRTIILAPHPDDEFLGCGGMIAELCRVDRPPLVVVLTDGTGSHPGSGEVPPDALRRLREQETADAVRHLGLRDADDLVFLRLRDSAAPHAGPEFDAAVSAIAAHSDGCETICATWGGDPHCDHEAADRMAQAVAARTGMRRLAYPVWGWALPDDAAVPGGEVAGWRLDIGASLPAKRAAIAAHRSQHGGVIGDDPDGFVLPPSLLEIFDRPFETFLAP